MKYSDSEAIKKEIIWREPKPNSDKTNIPFILFRGDENSTVTLSMALGLYQKEFKTLHEDEKLKICVSRDELAMKTETFSTHLDFPMDEKLATRVHGLAGSGSDYLCTYCDASRKKVREGPFSGAQEVTLSSTLLKEASFYCNLNPGKKSQEQLVKHSHGTKDIPLSSTEPSQETPDALHLDLNISKHLITIACRIHYFGQFEKPAFKYEKGGLLKEDLEKSEAEYFSKLREHITALPDLTQFPGRQLNL